MPQRTALLRRAYVPAAVSSFCDDKTCTHHAEGAGIDLEEGGAVEHEASSRAPAVLLALEDSGKQLSQCWLRACLTLHPSPCMH